MMQISTEEALNKLKNAITQMLLENKTNGVALQNTSEVLLNNVDKLNQSSNEAAQSLKKQDYFRHCISALTGLHPLPGKLFRQW